MHQGMQGLRVTYEYNHAQRLSDAVKASSKKFCIGSCDAKSLENTRRVIRNDLGPILLVFDCVISVSERLTLTPVRFWHAISNLPQLLVKSCLRGEVWCKAYSPMAIRFLVPFSNKRLNMYFLFIVPPPAGIPIKP
jgi:hypothetical protein